MVKGKLFCYILFIPGEEDRSSIHQAVYREVRRETRWKKGGGGMVVLRNKEEKGGKTKEIGTGKVSKKIFPIGRFSLVFPKLGR